jgi:hypothetical protein
MTSAIQFAIAIAMFIIAGGMIFYEYARSKAGRPLRNNEVTAMPYWLAYLLTRSARAFAAAANGGVLRRRPTRRLLGRDCARMVLHSHRKMRRNLCDYETAYCLRE